MPYRPTERTEARRAATRASGSCRRARAGRPWRLREAQVAAVAARAGVATGTVYRHFPSKADLLRRGLPARLPARGRRGRAAAAVADRLRRALRSPPSRPSPAARCAAAALAWALLAEPVDPAVEAERLVFRRGLRARLRRGRSPKGSPRGELPDQDASSSPRRSSARIGEALVGPLSPAARADDRSARRRRSSRSACAPSPTTGRPCRRSTVRRRQPPTRSPTSRPPLAGRNLFADNAPLAEALDREGDDGAAERAAHAGAFWGGEPMRWGALANENPPVLHTHDRYGHRLDEVEFHPAWHQLMAPASRTASTRCPGPSRARARTSPAPRST